MAMTSVAQRAQLCQVARPTAVKPARRVVQVAAKHDSPLKLAARSGAAAAAAALLLVCEKLFGLRQRSRAWRRFVCVQLYKNRALPCYQNIPTAYSRHAGVTRLC